MNSNPACKLVSVLLFLLAAPMVLAEDFYKWQDENGKWHFSDKAPENAPTTVEQGTVSVPNTTNTRQTNKDLKSVFSNETPAEIEHRKQQQAAEENQRAQHNRACQQARKQLKTIEGRVVFLDANGKPVQVSEDERIAKAAALRTQIERYCP